MEVSENYGYPKMDGVLYMVYDGKSENKMDESGVLPVVGVPPYIVILE